MDFGKAGELGVFHGFPGFVSWAILVLILLLVFGFVFLVLLNKVSIFYFGPSLGLLYRDVWIVGGHLRQT